MKVFGYLTEKGQALSAKLLSGTALVITRAAAGSGETALSASALAQERQTLTLAPFRRDGATVTLPVTLQAAETGGDYALTELGLYAQDPDEGEILYRLYRLDEAVGITAGGDLVIRFDLRETVSEAAEVQVEVTPTGVLLWEDLDGLRGVPGGLAQLNGAGVVPQAQLPAMNYAPPYTYGAEELEAGVSALGTGKLHFVYE